MDKKLNLHDVFGILFPGAVMCGGTYVFLLTLGRIASAQVDWGATLAMLPLAYVTGVLIHQIASLLFHERDVAVALMTDVDTRFTAAFKTNAKAAYVDLFALPADGDRAAQQMMFNGCYDYVLQQGKAIYVENHYASYALCRSMLVVVPALGVLGSVLVVKGHSPFPGHAGAELAGICAATAVALVIFWRAKDRFIGIFAAAVYRAFYSAYRDRKMPGAAPGRGESDGD